MSGQWTNKQLTGARRYRNGMFGGLILQVEERATFEGEPMAPYGDLPPAHGKSGLRWRDAVTEDLAALAAFD